MMSQLTEEALEYANMTANAMVLEPVLMENVKVLKKKILLSFLRFKNLEFHLIFLTPF